MKDYILFDLDGTLTNPKEGITKSVQYALRHYGIQVDDLDSLIPFIGPPLSESFRRFYGFEEQQSREAVLVYREYFTDRGWLENLEYPGVRGMLERLSAAGKHLMVATSKPEVFAMRILKHFNLDGYFEHVAGADLEETRVKKADVMRYLLERAGLGTDRESIARMVMVGDREHDVLGAAELGIDCVGVLHGYGSREELEQSGACAVVRDARELEQLLLTM